MTGGEVSFSAKGICVGEIHGIMNLWPFHLELLRRLCLGGERVSVLLERGRDQQAEIERWLSVGSPSKYFQSLFERPQNSSFLENEYEFLRGLAQLSRQFPNQIKAVCLDLTPAQMSDLPIEEDSFDREREILLIEALSSQWDEVVSADRIVLFAGNMHCSKTDWYFPLSDSPCEHISTLAHWLNQKTPTESFYCLPFAGEASYQRSGVLQSGELMPTSPLFKQCPPFEGLRRSSTLDVTPQFQKSYDWILGIRTARAALDKSTVCPRELRISFKAR